MISKSVVLNKMKEVQGIPHHILSLAKAVSQSSVLILLDLCAAFDNATIRLSSKLASQCLRQKVWSFSTLELIIHISAPHA